MIKRINFGIWIILLVIVCLCPAGMAAELNGDCRKGVLPDSTNHKKSLFKRITDYLAKSDEPDPNKKIDFGFLGGPHYSSDSGLGLGLVASGLYSIDRADTLLPLSNVSLYGDITTKGFMLLGLRGNNVFPQKKYRMDYRLYVYTFPSNFWGIGYENGDDGTNKSKYSRFKLELMGRFQFRLGRNSYLGPIARYQFVRAHSLKDKAQQLLEGQSRLIRDYGLGLSFTYDTRDFMLNAYKGWFVQFDGLYHPEFIGNEADYATADLTVCTYKEIWKGGVLAGELHLMQNFGNVPWAMMAEVGSSNRMRGYYEGRYRDKNVAEAQIELRQSVWKRHGIALWAGMAEVYPKFSALRWSKVLPNAGIGYRWEFKKRVNVRLDYGFTRNGGGFLFNINEAF